MAATAITFDNKSAADKFAAADNHIVVKVADVYAVIISDHKIEPINYFVWSTPDEERAS